MERTEKSPLGWATKIIVPFGESSNDWKTDHRGKERRKWRPLCRPTKGKRDGTILGAEGPSEDFLQDGEDTNVCRQHGMNQQGEMEHGDRMNGGDEGGNLMEEPGRAGLEQSGVRFGKEQGHLFIYGVDAGGRRPGHEKTRKRAKGTMKDPPLRGWVGSPGRCEEGRKGPAFWLIIKHAPGLEHLHVDPRA